MRPLPRKSMLFIAILVISALSCQTVTQFFETQPTPIPLHELENTPTTGSAMVTLTPFPTSTPAPDNTPTEEDSPVPPTPTLVPLSLEERLGLFDELWGIVNDEYLYADFNGQDWDALGEEYRRQVADLSIEDFYYALDEMIYLLGDDHSAYLSPQAAAAEDAEFAGNNDYVGIGIYHMPVPEAELTTVILTFPGSPAEKAGLKPHDNITAVDGKPLFNGDENILDDLRGPVGSMVTLTVQTPGQEPRQVTIERQRIQSSVPVPWALLTSPAGGRIGYILLTTFNDQTIPDEVEDALRAMTADGPLDGLIVDNRLNGGGADFVLQDTLRYFTSGTVGHFVNRSREMPLEVRARDINGSQEVPLVVLVGKDTVSFGEVFAGILQDRARAYLIGETTDGNVEILYGYDFTDGSQLWIAHDTFRPAIDTSADWEETGIIPEEEIPVQWHEVTLTTDPAVNAAMDYFDTLTK